MDQYSPDEFPSPAVYPAARGLVSGLDYASAWVMGFFGMLISGAYAVGAIAGMILLWSQASLALFALLPLFVAMLLLSLWHVVATLSALLRPQLPPPVQIALSQPRWPRGMNALIVLWWLMHLSTGA